MPSFKILEKNRRDCVTVQQQQQQQQQHTTLVKIASELTKQELKRHDENVFEASLRLKTNFHSVFWYNKPLSIKRERERELDTFSVGFHAEYVRSSINVSLPVLKVYHTHSFSLYLSLTHTHSHTHALQQYSIGLIQLSQSEYVIEGNLVKPLGLVFLAGDTIIAIVNFWFRLFYIFSFFKVLRSEIRVLAE